MLYCGKPPKEKYKKTGENIKNMIFLGATSFTELTLFYREKE